MSHFLLARYYTAMAYYNQYPQHVPPFAMGGQPMIPFPTGPSRKNSDSSESSFDAIPFVPAFPSESDSGPFIPPNFDELDEEEHKNKIYEVKPYRFQPSRNDWKHLPVTGLRLGGEGDSKFSHKHRGERPVSQVRIITWNVDYITPNPVQRLMEALRTIEEKVLDCKGGEAPEPCVIMLQEVAVVAFQAILEDEWVRRWFVLVPVSPDKWPETMYGNITLVTAGLNIAEAHILHYGPSRMQRTALCVKLKLHYPGGRDRAVVSFVNTHLESFAHGIAYRPEQLELCTRFVKLRGVEGGVIAGDMNPVCPEDVKLPQENGLMDAWRKGEGEEGHTWGFQGNTGYPTSRMDKILYRPNPSYRVDEPQKFGMGLTINTHDPKGGMSELFISDHYGLHTLFSITGRRQGSGSSSDW